MNQSVLLQCLRLIHSCWHLCACCQQAWDLQKHLHAELTQCADHMCISAATGAAQCEAHATSFLSHSCMSCCDHPCMTPLLLVNILPAPNVALLWCLLLLLIILTESLWSGGSGSFMLLPFAQRGGKGQAMQCLFYA